MARRPRRVLTWLLATALTCTVAAGCDKPAEDDGASEGAANETAPPEPTEPAPVPIEPRVAADPLARYAEHLATDSLAIGLVHPARLSTALAAELDAAAGGVPAGAGIADSQSALGEQLGPFQALLRPEGWQDTGLDASRPIAFAITTGPARALRDTFGELSPNLNAIETVSDLVYEAGQARNAAADKEVTAKADALRDKLHAVGFGVRLAIPVTDADTAQASLESMLEGAGFTADEAPHEGYAASYRSATGVPVHVRAATGDLLLVDGAWVPDSGEPEARATAATAIVAAIETGRPALEIPAFGDGALLSVTIDPGDLSRLDYLLGIDRALDQLAELQELGIGRRAEKGNALLEEDLKQLKYTVGLLDEVVRRGPFTGWSVTVNARSAGAPLQVVSRGLLRDPKPELAEVDGSSPAVQLDTALLTVSVNPMIAATEGPWADAGLAAGKWTTPETLSKSASLGQMPDWMSHPAMLGLWLYPLPSAAWREHAPDALATVVPGADRVQLAVGLGSTEPVLVAVDGADQLDAWRNALACTAAGKPTPTGCDASTVPSDAPGALAFGDTKLNARAAARDDRAVVAVSRATAPIAALDAATVDSAPGLLSASLDLGALSGSGLPAGAVALGQVLGEWLRGMELVTTLEPEAVVWTLSVDSDVALLLGLHGLTDTLPVTLPSSSALISLSLAGLYEHRPIEIEGPKKPSTASSSSGKARTARAAAPDNLAGIKKAFDDNRGQVEKCAQRIKQKFGSASGELAVMVYLEASGKVDKVRVRRDDIGNGLGRCVADSIETWTFPPQGDYVQVGKKWKL